MEINVPYFIIEFNKKYLDEYYKGSGHYMTPSLLKVFAKNEETARIRSKQCIMPTQKQNNSNYTFLRPSITESTFIRLIPFDPSETEKEWVKHAGDKAFVILREE